MFDASAPSEGQPGFDPARRQTLITLATLPLAIGIGVPTGIADNGAATEAFLANCGASLTACWHLLNGSDLDLVDRLLSGYLSQLELVARKPSKYQQTAALLASQAHHLGAIITFHRGRMRAREHHCKQALEYAAVAADIPSQVSTLLTLGSTYFFGDDPVRAVQTYEKALTFDAGMKRGHAFTALARQYPQRDYAQTAADVFSRMEQSPSTSVPVRV